MKKFQLFITLIMAISLSGCARDLSSSTYTSEDTLNIVLEGIVLTTRNVKIKENDRMQDNKTGGAIGAVSGALAGGGASGGRAGGIIGGAVLGGVLGAATEGALGTSKGVEYTIRIDKSQLGDDYYEGSTRMRNALAAAKATGIITVVQSAPGKNDPVVNSGQDVLVIVSEKRSRVIPKNM